MVVPPVVDTAVYVMNWAFVSQVDCKLMFAVMACWGAAPSGYTSWCPLLAQGHFIWSRKGPLKISVLNSPFIRFWGD